MKTVFGALIFSGVILSFLASIILITVGKGRSRINQLLAVVLFTVGLDAFFKILFLANVMTEMSAYFKFVVPVFYLIPPSIYIYSYVALYGTINLKRLWLHLLPSVLIAISALVFFFLLDKKGYEFIQLVADDRRSVFTVEAGTIFLGVQFLTRTLQGFIYLFLQCRLIYRYHRRVERSSWQTRKIYHWVLVLTFTEISLFVFMLLYHILILQGQVTLGYIVNLGLSVLCVCYIGFPIYLYLSPSLLYGGGTLTPGITELHQDIPAETVTLQEAQEKQLVIMEKSNTSPYTDEDILEYKYRLEHIIVETKLFRTQGLKVQEVARVCEIPPRALSYLLATVYNKGFNDFINECRIDYVVDRLTKDDWKDLTLEGLGFEAGFSSRTTFFIAFKKYKMVNPTKYIQMHQFDRKL